MLLFNRPHVLLLGAATAVAVVVGLAWGGGGPDTDSPYNMPKMMVTNDGNGCGSGGGASTSGLTQDQSGDGADTSSQTVVATHTLSAVTVSVMKDATFVWFAGAPAQPGLVLGNAVLTTPHVRTGTGGGNVLVAPTQSVQAAQAANAAYLSGDFTVQPAGVPLRMVAGVGVASALCAVEIIGASGLERFVVLPVASDGFDVSALSATLQAYPTLAGKNVRMTLIRAEANGPPSVTATCSFMVGPTPTFAFSTPK